MAMTTNFVTPAKSGSAWNDVHLKAFDIEIVEIESSTEFFGVAKLPDPKVSDAILTTYSSEAALAVSDPETCRFLCFMEDAMTWGANQSDVDNFAIELFRLMRYDSYAIGYRAKFIVHLTFRMCDQDCEAQTAVCVMDQNKIFLVVQEDKQICNPESKLPVGQLVAEPIAAFHHNNIRLKYLGKKPLSDYLMPGIIYSM
jgi:hypothetical protein